MNYFKKSTLVLMFLTLNTSFAEGSDELKKAIDLFFIDCHVVPQELDQLLVKPANCKNWGPDPYITEVPNDRWGHPWRYRRMDNENYELISLGADDREGGVGDDMDTLVRGEAPHLNR